MVEALPEPVKIALGALVCLALPFMVGWMIWSLVRSGRGVARGMTGGPAKACEALGLRVERVEPLSGEAAGLHRGCPVRVSWRVGPQHGFAEHHQKTWVRAQVRPSLGAGLEARDELPPPSPPWPELGGLGARADDPAAARAALGRAGPALGSALRGPGRLAIDDASVTIELLGIETDRSKLTGALDTATAVAAALSSPLR